MAYCTKCGKEINYESPLCIECVAMLKIEAEEIEKKPEPEILPEAEPSKDSFYEQTSESFYESSYETEAEPEAEEASAEDESVYGSENIFSEDYSYTPPTNNIFSGDYSSGFNQGKNPKMVGFGRALFATIIAFFGDLVASIVTIFPLMGELYGVNYNLGGAEAILNWLVAFPAAVIGIVFGILSIVTFRRNRYHRPIATLVLGIAALSLGGSTLMALLTMI